MWIWVFWDWNTMTWPTRSCYWLTIVRAPGWYVRRLRLDWTSWLRSPAKSFTSVVDSMVTQHFKWLRKCKTHGVRTPSLRTWLQLQLYSNKVWIYSESGILTRGRENSSTSREYLRLQIQNSLLAVMDKNSRQKTKVNDCYKETPVPEFCTPAEEAEELVQK